MHFIRELRQAAVALATVAATLALSGCELQPVAPKLAATPVVPEGPPGEFAPVALAEVRCVADREAKSVECAPVSPSTNGALGDLVVGGQNLYVSLTSSNVNYVGTSFTFDVTLRNLIPQPLGTSDGSTADPAGSRVFFHSGPTVLTGTGTITVAGDGTGSFTGTNQPYYAYVGLLPQYTTSSPRTWQLTMPPTVNTFSFTVYVSTPVQFPGGYVRLQAGSTNIRADGIRQVTAASKTNVGNTVAGQTITWSILPASDTTIATVDATGLVSGVREGAVTVSATDGTRSGVLAMTITPINRFWTAAAGTTDFETKTNWSRNVVPTVSDTLDIQVAPFYPTLTQNKFASSLIVDNSAAFNLSAFNLTLAQGLTVGSSVAFGSTSGLLVLTGPGFTIASSSSIPRTTITSTGSYTLSTNLVVKQRVRIDGGRLRSNAARIRIDNIP